jgi:hypothetical protein
VRTRMLRAHFDRLARSRPAKTCSMVTEQAEQSPDVLGPACIKDSQRRNIERIHSWRQFHNHLRAPQLPLLPCISRYPGCVLVAGCQRSGTTMLTRVVAASRGFKRFALTHDDELDAALILAGAVDLPEHHRYCFQTTYLNERFGEYAALGPDQKLIWVLRNPYSVVFSMVYNWKRFALNELYESCGAQHSSRHRVQRRKHLWSRGPSPLEKACLSYAAKTSQVLLIRELVLPAQLMVLDYDRLVRAPEAQLPPVFKFVAEPYEPSYAARVKSTSLRKSERLSVAARKLIDEIAMPAYEACVSMVVA